MAKTDYYDEEDKSSSDAPALLPKSILMGKKFEVGDEVVLKITAIHDDQVAVAYASGEDSKEEEGETESEQSGSEDNAPTEEVGTEGESAPADAMYD